MGEPRSREPASAYLVGEHLVLVTSTGGEWPVEVTGHNSLPCDLVVRWTGKIPLGALGPALGQSTVCLQHLKEVRRG
jgi:hypothetical protein